jgi:hypothetical protein
MHHIALAPHAWRILILSLTYACAIDHVEPRAKIRAEQVQWVFGGPQASSCEDANIVVIKASPGASHTILIFYFLINIFILRMIVH